MSEHQTSSARNEAQHATSIFVDRIRKDAVNKFEDWLDNIHKDARKAKGFVDVSSIRTDAAQSAEFVTLLTFDSQQSLTDWVQSEQSQTWLSHLPGLLQEQQTSASTTGLGLWTTPGIAAAPFWKQVVLGTITVYPAVIGLNYGLNPLIGHLPTNLSILIVVIILSALLTWPIMPLAIHLLRNWLKG